ncbi:hypothetical protein HPP92_017926 [Vanilla planifolia]|uniref:Uncharacterized protein n=1 Tax=Vanilla planifolia TaxID=51239 RepID=A0A835QC05_VANPL|nr:hypothetical protein HPP92_017926 [Vanilla planifolia]
MAASYIPLQPSLSTCKEACAGAVNSTKPRDDLEDTFASYLAVVRDSYDHTQHKTSSAERGHSQPPRVNLTRKRPDDDSEIDIFGAEKYFGASEYASPNSVDPRAAALLSKSRSSTWSETCSGNSRAILLRPRQRTPLHQLGGLICCSSCSRNRDVIIVHKENSTGINSYRSDQNDFSTASWKIEMASPAGPWLWPSTNCNGKSVKEDALDPSRISESSSELFEIESVCFGRSGGYEPSEASIEWSVATASAANVSVASDRSGEIGGHRERSQQGPRSGATASLLFGGCASQKAVRVMSGHGKRDQCSGDRGGAAEAEISSAPSARYHVDLDAAGGTARVMPLRSARVSLESLRTGR